MLSIITPFQSATEDHLKLMAKSFPKGSEWILVQTVRGNDVKARVGILKELDTFELEGIKVRQFTYSYYNEEYDWVESFSELRNTCMSVAKGDWILWVDSDEFLCNSELYNWNTLFNDKSVGGYSVTVFSYSLPITGVTGRYADAVLRLHRNDKRFFWINRIHEQIKPSIELTGLAVKDCQILIQHLGYLRHDIPYSLKKLHRNKVGMYKDLAERPNDQYLTERLAINIRNEQILKDVLKRNANDSIQFNDYSGYSQ